MKLNRCLLILSSLFSLITYANDFPIAMPKTSSSFLFSESINNQVGFSVSQTDKSLMDLFDQSKTPPASNLCGPTSVSNLMAYLKFSDPVINKDLSLKFDPTNPSYSAEVREYFNLCKTNSKSGTLIVDMATCISDTFKQSHFQDSSVKVVGPVALPNLAPEFLGPIKNVDVNDIRDAIKNNFSVILELKWFSFDQTVTPNKWVSNAGHYILVVGYDYDESFGDSKIILKVVNPEVNYMVRDPYQRYDNIDMIKIPKKAGQVYPDGSDYILDGYNFKGYPTRAFVKYLILSRAH